MEAIHGTGGQAFVPRSEGVTALRWISGIAGALTLCVGIAALVWPGPTLAVVGFLFGVYYTIWAIGLLVRGIVTPDLPTGLRVVEILAGVLGLFAGLLLMVRPEESIAAVAWVLGFWLVVVGVLRLVGAMVDREARLWKLAWGVVGIVAGIIILASPEIALGTLVVIVGIGLIVQGLLELLVAFSPSRAGA